MVSVMLLADNCFEYSNNESPNLFLTLVAVYVICSFLFLIPVALCTRWKRLHHISPSTSDTTEINGGHTTGSSKRVPLEGVTSSNAQEQASYSSIEDQSKLLHKSASSSMAVLEPQSLDRESPIAPREPSSTSGNGSHTDQVISDPNAVSTSMVRLILDNPDHTDHSARNRLLRQRSTQSLQQIANLTNRMGLTQGFQPSAARAQAVRRFVHAERQSVAAGTEEGGSGSASRSGDPSWLLSQRSGPLIRRSSHTGIRVSAIAGGILSSEVVDGESDSYRQHFVEMSKRLSQRRSFSSGRSDLSIMPPLQSIDLTPDDAADAHDPGRANPLHYYDSVSSSQWPQRVAKNNFGFTWSQLGHFLDYVELDSEMISIIWVAVPSIAGAVADKIMRLVLIGIISSLIDTQSMVAFVLVSIFLHMTVEVVSGAITDTEVTNIQTALTTGGDEAFFKSGKIMQLALIIQTLTVGPILIGWVFGIETLVNWLLSGVCVEISNLAKDYTKVIVFDSFLRVVSKTFFAPFHMNGRATFETIVDVVGAILTVGAIGIVAFTNFSLGAEPTLVTVASIQVIASFVKIVVKISYVTLKGWFQPYRTGFFSDPSLVMERRSVGFFFLTALPLFFGSIVELREWDILIIFVRYIGPGEVTVWAIMAVVWELFEASTDGLGSAGAMRISYYLSRNLPDEARMISYKIFFLAAIQVFCLASIFLMIGPNLSVWLTKNYVLQNMFYNLVGMTTVANFSMTFALSNWSLVGLGQGRFGTATACIVLCRWVIVYPVASLCVFRFHHEITSVAGSIAVGYASAGYALGCVLIRSDWKQLALKMQENWCPENDDNDVQALSFDYQARDVGLEENECESDEGSCDSKDVITT